MPTTPLPNLPVALVDYETYYDSEYSVQDMSYWHYCHDPKFDAYLVSIVTSDGFEWVGNPKDAPWEKIANHYWVSHNKAFDETVHNRLIELGIVSIKPVYWGDSINLCAWLRVARALNKAVYILYGVVLDKSVRDKKTKGKKYADYSPELKAEAHEYALNDGRWALKIWMDNINKWPDHERRISDLYIARGLKGFYADKAGIETDLVVLERLMFEARSRIPWADNENALVSKPLCDLECQRNGIEPPASLDMKSESLEEWEERYGEQYPFVAAMRDYRRANMIAERLKTMLRCLKPDGRIEFSIRYLGTHTGRTASGEKHEAKKRKTFNPLNMPRDPLFVTKTWSTLFSKKDIARVNGFIKKNGKLPDDVLHKVDVRAKIIAPPGFKFGICDAAQIEARITNWISQNKEMMDLIRAGFSVYVAHAKTTMGWEGGDLKKENPQKYALAKSRELGLGFGCGHVKFIIMAPLYIEREDVEIIFGAPVSEEDRQNYVNWLLRTRQTGLVKVFESLPDDKRVQRVNSWKIVQDFRAKRPGLASNDPANPGLWKRMDNDLQASIGGTYEIVLPNGRVLTYFNVRKEGSEIKCEPVRGERTMFLHGSKCLENTVQSFAREIFVHHQLMMDDLGYWVVLDVYDETVLELPEGDDGSKVVEIMSTTPSFAPGLPLGAELEISQYYKK
jgi:hypothetical protein